LQQQEVQLVINSLLQSKAQLKRLALNGLEMKDSHISQMSEWLPTQAKSLEYLMLGSNHITCAGLFTLLGPFYHAGSACRLECLDLRRNCVGEAGAELLICHPLASLTIPGLTENPLIRESQFKLLVQAYCGEASFSNDSSDEAEDINSNESND
jgi:hypothetical protein